MWSRDLIRLINLVCRGPGAGAGTDVDVHLSMSFRNVFSGVALQHAACRVARGCRTRPGQLHSSPERGRSCPIHPELMKVLVCPLSKEPLRWVA